MNEMQGFITSVGFPIAVACGFGVVLYKVFMVVFSKIINTLDELTKTNRLLAEGVEKRIDKIDNKVDLIIEKIS